MDINGITVGTQERLILANTACACQDWKPPVKGQTVREANLHFYEAPKIVRELLKERIESVTPHETNSPQHKVFDIRTRRSTILVNFVDAPRYKPLKVR